MPKETSPNSAVNWDRYRDTSARIASLKVTLPRDAVQDLALEVLTRMAAKAETILGHSVHNPSPEQIDELAAALLSKDVDAGLNYILQVIDDGASVEEACITYLAAVARRIGVMWEDSTATFVQVTTATSRIFSIMRALEWQPHKPVVTSARAGLFISTPGETHTLGVRMATDLFRRNGWEVDVLLGLDHADVLAQVDASEHLLIGISAGGAASLPALAKLTLALRIHRPAAFILIAGNVVETSREIIEKLPADAYAADFDQAAKAMEGFWQKLQAQAKT